jgi:hypothetical protein
MIFKLAEAAEKSWRNRGRQIASSNRCRLIPPVTKIRR